MQTRSPLPVAESPIVAGVLHRCGTRWPRGGNRSLKNGGPDHGAQPPDGGFCINEWLVDEGLLALREYPDEVRSLDECEIDWGKTKVWGEGGYYAGLLDIAPTLLDLGGYDAVDSMQGRSLLGREGATSKSDTTYSEEAEEVIRQRLKGLGCISKNLSTRVT
jgi:hypothetical protein